MRQPLSSPHRPFVGDIGGNLKHITPWIGHEFSSIVAQEAQEHLLSDVVEVAPRHSSPSGDKSPQGGAQFPKPLDKTAVRLLDRRSLQII